MYNFIHGIENWKKHFKTLDQNAKKTIWIVVSLNNNQVLYLDDHKKWLELKSYIANNKLSISNIGLRYKSHEINQDTKDSDGVYVIRSILGQVGADTRQTYTIGVLHDNTVTKTVWYTPELIAQETYDDELNNCFKEALIYNVGEKAKA